MRKNIIMWTLMLCFSLSGGAYAQRALAGMRGVELHGGFVDGIRETDSQKLGYYYSAGISKYLRNGNRCVYGVEYLQKYCPYKCKRFPVSQFTAESGYYKNILSDATKTFFLSLGASALAGYETSNWGSKTLFDGASLTHKDGFIYGGAVTLQGEAYLNDWLVLLLSLRERCLWGTSTGHFHTQLGVGFRLMIN